MIITSGNYIYRLNNVNLTGSYISIDLESDLVYNEQYDITLLAGISGIYNDATYYLNNDYSFYFTSQYCPLFSTINRVKLTGGPIIDSFTDDTILRTIHKNSIDAVDLYNISQTTNYAYGYWGCAYENVPLQLRRYVECKTAYDLISLIKLTNSISGSGSNQLKVLGDMTIKYGNSSNDNSSKYDPNKLKELFDCWNEMLRSFRTINYAVKGLNDISKSYAHPVMNPYENRILRPVTPNQNNYTPGTTYWRTI